MAWSDRTSGKEKNISTGWRQEGGGRGKAKGNQLLNDSYEEISLKKKKKMAEGLKKEKWTEYKNISVSSI